MPLSKEALDRLERKRGSILKEVNMMVLVWGPGMYNASTREYEKRLRIRDVIEDIVGKGNVFFSEEVEQFAEMDLVSSEYIQAETADAIIVIPETLGSVAETVLFRRQIREKGLVFISTENRGFAREAFNGLRIEEVEPDEWKTCERTRKIAKDFVHRRMIEKREALKNAERFL